MTIQNRALGITSFALLMPLIGATQAIAQRPIGNLNNANIRVRTPQVQLTPDPDCINFPYCYPQIDLEDIEIPPICDPRVCDPPKEIYRLPEERYLNTPQVEQLQQQIEVQRVQQF